MGNIKARGLIVTQDFESQAEKYRRVMSHVKNPGAASVTAIGFPAAPTLTATVASADTSVRPWLQHSTAATNGAVTGMISPAFQVIRNWNVEFSTEVEVSGTQGYRATVGFCSAAPDTSDYTQGVVPSVQFVGFQTNNPNSGGPSFFRWNWICCTCDGLVIQRTPSNVSTFSGAVSKLRVLQGAFPNPSLFNLPTIGWKFFIDDVYITTHFQVVPNVFLGYAIRHTNTAAVANNIKWSNFTVRHTG